VDLVDAVMSFGWKMGFLPIPILVRLAIKAVVIPRPVVLV